MAITYGSKIETYGLVFYFDAANTKSYIGSGSTAYDISGNGAVGALTNVTYSNGYMTFSGGAGGSGTSYINFGNPSALALSSEITIIAWTYPITTSGLGNIVSKNENNGYRIRHEQTNNLWFYGSNQVFTPNASISLNVWQHSAITGNAAGLTAYINTISLASTASPFNPIAPGNGDFYIGCTAPGQQTFDGRISMVQIYNRALTQLEIRQNYVATKGRYGL